jgi:hypothetical protein
VFLKEKQDYYALRAGIPKKNDMIRIYGFHIAFNINADNSGVARCGFYHIIWFRISINFLNLIMIK